MSLILKMGEVGGQRYVLGFKVYDAIICIFFWNVRYDQ